MNTTIVVIAILAALALLGVVMVLISNNPALNRVHFRLSYHKAKLLIAT
jgi:hypothetical protein